MYNYRPAETGRTAMLRDNAIKSETGAANLAIPDTSGSGATIDDYPSAADNTPRSRLTGRTSKPVP